MRVRHRHHGEETLAEIGRSYNVSGWTIARHRGDGAVPVNSKRAKPNSQKFFEISLITNSE
jgi:hypothetical protein